MLKRFVCCLWLSAVILTYLPLFGFGLYYDYDAGQGKEKCTRFRYAVDLKDKIYAYLFFTFGKLNILPKFLHENWIKTVDPI